MKNRRKQKRSSIKESLCAVFSSGSFGQIRDISKNGISILLFGTTKAEQRISLDIFQLCGNTIVENLQCEVVRRESINVSKELMAKEGELIGLSFTQNNRSIDTIIRDFS